MIFKVVLMMEKVYPESISGYLRFYVSMEIAKTVKIHVKQTIILYDKGYSCFDSLLIYDT